MFEELPVAGLRREILLVLERYDRGEQQSDVDAHDGKGVIGGRVGLLCGKHSLSSRSVLTSHVNHALEGQDATYFSL